MPFRRSPGKPLASRLPALILVALASGAGLSCRALSPPPAPPIVLITFTGLRADAVGFLGGPPRLTPVVDRLAAEVDWAGPAVAAAGSSGPALATLLTGLRPWQHQALDSGAPPAAELHTLAEALAERGYRTSAYFESGWLNRAPGFTQGFAQTRGGKPGRAARHLESLAPGELVWVQLERPAPRYQLYRRFLGRLPAVQRDLPPRLDRAQLRAYRQAGAPAAAERARLWALYCLNVAAADEELGQLWQALARGPHFAEALVVVTADRGEELGEHGGVGEGGGLGRELVEVPLLVKLPAAARGRLAVRAGERVAIARLLATAVELAGGAPPPAVAPSLLRRAPAGILSELYGAGGRNEFSWVEEDLQLRRVVRLAPSPEGGEPRFLTTPPFSGQGGGADDVELVLERWRRSGGSEPAADAAAAARLAAALAARWNEFLDEERAPAAEAARRYVGEPSAILVPRPRRGHNAAGP